MPTPEPISSPVDVLKKRKAGSAVPDLAADEGTVAKRTRSSSGSRGISNEDILYAIRNSEERIVKEMHSLMDSKIAVVRTEFDEKLKALTSSIDDRIQDVLRNVNGSVTSNDNNYEKVVSTIDAATELSNLRIDSLERAHSLGDVIVNGIPVVDNEDVCAYFKSICEAISFQCGVRAASSVFRIPVKSKNSNALNSSASGASIPKVVAPPIIIKFLNSDLSRQFISCYLKFNKLNLTHVGFGTPTRIYVNENLTKFNRDIFRYCLQLKHRHKSVLLQVFTRFGIVHVKFTALDKPISIQSKKEIDSYITKFAV